MDRLFLPFTPRFITLTLAAIATLVLVIIIAGTGGSEIVWWFCLAAFAGLSALGVHDLAQQRHAILRNYPIAAHLRFIFEAIRPEMRQYFFESEKDGAPFSRDRRAIVYQRAKKAPEKRPFGTQYDVYAEGYEWVHHSMAPNAVADADFRVAVGGPDCAKPYSASIFNISAMSFGSLSANAIRALNKGAAMGCFAHDTGEGGFTMHHAAFGGDIILEIGSGYFGARTLDGKFSPERFAETAANPQIKMIELKLSQGAKPGHGGVLPAVKVSAEIAAARGVAQAVDCVSPSRHSAFSTPIEMMLFIAELRRLSGGKPTGFKLCVGHPWEFLALCKAMLETGVYPDFIVVDGKEGGTGAAPLEFMDHLGMPMREGLNFVHNALVGIDARERIRLGASGKIVTAFDIARAMALGADWCNAARGFMFAVGCLQSHSCHTDRCPTGVATQDPTRQRALVVPNKAERVLNYHKQTTKALAEFVAAAGLRHPGEFAPAHFSRRISSHEVLSLAESYPALERGALLAGSQDRRYADAWAMADAQSFRPKP
ncbi:ferredoxin-dependent glutamate synthase [Methylocella silvestris BL2]|uniref:Ferredoxin-dependent glutamate synthase n=1 Tax=Methylocella silvestris (strain DSM 15510 / CIP 108128 / LMG 27833 / NCIMB 13906 / BL2) TaxID=395965 RepID=B8ER52_METSB|nr:FMN-binding glutamate synthase family protein [Methylocella silvestris]ACK49797.1 ferredoxin-dependent glutamate synthase [Methylocella silvestris BL2]